MEILKRKEYYIKQLFFYVRIKPKNSVLARPKEHLKKMQLLFEFISKGGRGDSKQLNSFDALFAH